MDKANLGYALAGASVVAGLILYLRRSGAGAAAPLVKPGDRVVLIGDSLGVGLRKPLAQKAQTSGVEFWGQACGGTMIFQWLKERTAYPAHDTSKAKQCNFGLGYVRDVAPTVVLISLGTNDSYSTLDQIEKERSDVQTLVQAIRDMGAVPIWIDPPKLVASPHVPEMREIIYSGLAGGIHHFATSEMDIPMGPDKIHPTGEGYQRWADALWASLTALP